MGNNDNECVGCSNILPKEEGRVCSTCMEFVCDTCADVGNHQVDECAGDEYD